MNGLAPVDGSGTGPIIALPTANTLILNSLPAIPTEVISSDGLMTSLSSEQQAVIAAKEIDLSMVTVARANAGTELARKGKKPYTAAELRTWASKFKIKVTRQSRAELALAILAYFHR